MTLLQVVVVMPLPTALLLQQLLLPRVTERARLLPVQLVRLLCHAKAHDAFEAGAWRLSIPRAPMPPK